MESVLVEVFIPATDSVHDFMLPANGRIATVALQMAEALESVERNIAFDRKNLTLCDRLARRILPPEATLYDCGIVDGSSLILL